MSDPRNPTDFGPPHLSRKATLLSRRILSWYLKHQRTLPWRARQGERPNPYYVWLSEMMLQQTTVPTVIPYFENFIHQWPNFQALSEASLDHILHAWQGLGYYARAKNLYQTAQLIHTEFQNKLPSDPKTLETLPGIGPYTAGAIAAIAFDQPAAPIDGNIIRILSRLYKIEEPLPKSLPFLHKLAQHLTPQSHCGAYIQGLMDLGSLICRPTSPTCPQCPVNGLCKAYQEDNPMGYPKRLAKVPKPLRRIRAYWIQNSEGEVLLEKRPLTGLLGGMVLTPLSAWNALEEIPSGLYEFFKKHELYLNPTVVHHVFTHFKLHVEILQTKRPIKKSDCSFSTLCAYFWCPQTLFENQAFPSLMKKIIQTVRNTQANCVKDSSL